MCSNGCCDEPNEQQNGIQQKYDELETVTVSFTDFNGTSLPLIISPINFIIAFYSLFSGYLWHRNTRIRRVRIRFSLDRKWINVAHGRNLLRWLLLLLLLLLFCSVLCVCFFFFSRFSCGCFISYGQSSACMPIDLSTTTSSTFDFAHYRRRERQHSLKTHSIFAEWLSSRWKRIMACLTLHWNQFRLNVGCCFFFLSLPGNRIFSFFFFCFQNEFFAFLRFFFFYILNLMRNMRYWYWYWYFIGALTWPNLRQCQTMQTGKVTIYVFHFCYAF